NAQTVRRGVVERPLGSLLDRYFRQRYASSLFSSSKINNDEYVKVIQIHEHAFCRAVRIRLNSHWPDAFIEERPCNFVGLRVNDGHDFARNRARNKMLAVGSHIEVMDTALGRNAA